MQRPASSVSWQSGSGHDSTNVFLSKQQTSIYKLSQHQKVPFKDSLVSMAAVSNTHAMPRNGCFVIGVYAVRYTKDPSYDTLSHDIRLA